ncbi:MAG: hypothetical protein ACKVU1_00410 [bacterium]
MNRKSTLRCAAAGLVLALALLAARPVHAAEIHWRGIGAFTARGEASALDLNRNNYRDSGFDPVRARLFLDVPLSERVAVFGQILFDDVSSVPARTYGLYATATGFGVPNMTLEFGKIPLLFGTFAPRTYENKNPLIAAPLAYQFHTTLRDDQLPVSPAALVEMRGRGQHGVFFTDFHGNPAGSTRTTFGAPILYDSCWDIGAAALGTWRRVEYAMGVTQGTVGVPNGTRDSNNARQVLGRVGVVPVTGLRVSFSAAQGAYLSATVAPLLPEGARVEDFKQTATALSLDWSVGHAALFAEVIDNTFESPWINEDLETIAWYAEGKYTFLPGAYAAARFDQLRFGKIAYEDPETFQMRRDSWDIDVQRVETALGYWVTPGLLTRFDVQFWDQGGGGWNTTQTLAALQAVVAF